MRLKVLKIRTIDNMNILTIDNMKCKFCHRVMSDCITDFYGLCVKNPKSSGKPYRKGKRKS